MLNGMSVFGVNSGMGHPVIAIRSLMAATMPPHQTDGQACDLENAKAQAGILSNIFVNTGPPTQHGSGEYICRSSSDRCTVEMIQHGVSFNFINATRADKHFPNF